MCLISSYWGRSGLCNIDVQVWLSYTIKVILQLLYLSRIVVGQFNYTPSLIYILSVYFMDVRHTTPLCKKENKLLFGTAFMYTYRVYLWWSDVIYFSQLNFKTKGCPFWEVFCLHSCGDAFSYSSCTNILAIALKSHQLDWKIWW